MDRRFLTVLGVSLVFALVVSSIFYQISARGGSSNTAGDTEMKDLVVAVKPLAIGATITADDLKVVKVPTAQYPAGGVSKAEEVVGRPVISNILLDEPIHVGRLAPLGSGTGLAPVIPAGMRAVTLKANEVIGVAGFVLPGMRVDVLVTGQPPDSGDEMTTTILQNVLVLTAGQTMEADGQGRAIPSRVVTLLVTPQQAEIITLAENEGRVRLVLRNGSDQSIAKTKGARKRELYGKDRRRPAPPPRPVAQVPVITAPPPPRQPDQIVVFRGTKKSVQVVNSGQGSYQ